MEDVLAHLNATELYQLCRRAGLATRPGEKPAYYIKCLKGELAPGSDPFDTWRDALIKLIGLHWMTLQAQLVCEARNLKHPDPEQRNERPCYGCTNLQVLKCVSSPKVYNHIVKLRKK